MALFLVQLGPFQWVLESSLGRVSRETPEPEIHEVEAEVAHQDPTPIDYPLGFQRNPTPLREEDDDGME